MDLNRYEIACREAEAYRERYEDAKLQLTKAHNRIDALEKRVVMFRGLMVAALTEIKATGESEGVLFGPDQQIDEKITQALDATQDLSGLVLCRATPVGFMAIDGYMQKSMRNGSDEPLFMKVRP